MPFHCVAYGCTNRQKSGSGVHFYRFPANKDRRDKWLAAIKRDNWAPTVYSRLCSTHFISGQKNNNPLSPDYVPSIFSFQSSPDIKRKKAQLDRFNKRQSLKRQRCDNTKRQDAAAALLSLSAEPTQVVAAEFNDQDDVQSEATTDQAEGMFIQTDMTASDIHSLELQCQALQTEVYEERARVEALSTNRRSFEDNDEKVKFYTGLSSFAILEALFTQIETHIHVVQGLSKFQQFIITLMRLRLNLSCQDLAFRFGVHVSTVSRVFQKCIDICNAILVPMLVIWPDPEQQRLTVPASFRKRFWKCVSIIDCFEIFIDRPTDLKARAQTWSFYKNHNTAKYLISITPQGTINFISAGYGGRASDRYITEHCGYLQNLNPGNLVLADRGFNIQDTLAYYGATLHIPAFTKGKKQLDAKEIEATRTVANVRIHVERVIGETRNRYTILKGQIPLTMLVPDSISNLTALDKVVRVCCALIGASESVVPFD